MSVRRSLIASISLVMLFVAPGSALAGTSDLTPPNITITTPAPAAVYLLNEVVYSNYSCSDSGGSGLAACGGPGISGSQVDTTALGSHYFAVVAFDYAGNNTTTVHSYSVVPDAKPDARIRRIGRTSLVGNNIYNADATSQELNATLNGTATRRFVISVQNDSPTDDSFKFAATGDATAGYGISYFHGQDNITAAVQSGAYTSGNLSPGEVFRIRAVVQVSLSADPGVTRLVTVTSVGNPSKVDAVRFTVGVPENPCLAACV